jgi:hypothetical protein
MSLLHALVLKLSYLSQFLYTRLDEIGQRFLTAGYTNRRLA